jgi:hypothetical protein
LISFQNFSSDAYFSHQKGISDFPQAFAYAQKIPPAYYARFSAADVNGRVSSQIVESLWSCLHSARQLPVTQFYFACMNKFNQWFVERFGSFPFSTLYCETQLICIF